METAAWGKDREGGIMNLHGEFSVACDVCDQLVMAGDVKPRRNLRAFRSWEGDALLCPLCAWTVDHIRPRIGLRYGTVTIQAPTGSQA